MADYIYLGPTSTPHGLNKNKIFKGSIPAAVATLAAKVPAVFYLTVNLLDRKRVSDELNRRGSTADIYYRRIADGSAFAGLGGGSVPGNPPALKPWEMPFYNTPIQSKMYDDEGNIITPADFFGPKGIKMDFSGLADIGGGKADVRRGYDVKEEGAKGDKVTDDTVAIQNAIDKAYSKGYEGIYLPIGKYRTTKPLILPKMERPNTAATQGKGFLVLGAGMYDTGIIYEGNEYAIYSDKDMAESILFQDFYINHRNGGGVRIPQGAHQMFDRFFSSACGEGYRGVWIEGDRSELDLTGGYGSYMVSFRNSRFWEETGYRGIGVRIEDAILCTTFDNCFFSRSVRNYSHLELVNCSGVDIRTSAFERTEQQVDPVNELIGRTEEVVQREAVAANALMTAPLIMLDNCYAVNIESSHAEATYESFVGIKNHTSGVKIDGCRLDHYALTPWNPNKGYVVSVDEGSTSSRDIIIGARNYRIQSNHKLTTHGSMISDPVGCVTVENFHDYTRFINDNNLTERRSVPYIGKTGANILHNPSFGSTSENGIPDYLELIDGDWSFSQLPNISGCNIKQTGPRDVKYRLRLRTVESLNKHSFYSVVLVARNKIGKSCEMYIDIGGDTNDLTFIIPSGTERFTHIQQIKGQASDIVDIVTYAPFDIDLYALYLIPGIVTEVPYGSESQSFTSVKAVDMSTVAIKIEPSKTLPTPGPDYRGIIMRKEEEGTADALLICKRLANGSFEWVEI